MPIRLCIGPIPLCIACIGACVNWLMGCKAPEKSCGTSDSIDVIWLAAPPGPDPAELASCEPAVGACAASEPAVWPTCAARLAAEPSPAGATSPAKAGGGTAAAAAIAPSVVAYSRPTLELCGQKSPKYSQVLRGDAGEVLAEPVGGAQRAPQVPVGVARHRRNDRRRGHRVGVDRGLGQQHVLGAVPGERLEATHVERRSAGDVGGAGQARP